MTAAAGRYARLLLEQAISRQAEDDLRTLAADPDLREAMESPVYAPQEKAAVIGQLFPMEAQPFCRLLCANGDYDLLPEILDRYDELVRARDGVARVTFTCCHEPTAEQRQSLESLVCQKFGKTGVEWHTVHDPAILGGFILTVDDWVLDRSLRSLAEDLHRHITRGSAI